MKSHVAPQMTLGTWNGCVDIKSWSIYEYLPLKRRWSHNLRNKQCDWCLHLRLPGVSGVFWYFNKHYYIHPCLHDTKKTMLAHRCLVQKFSIRFILPLPLSVHKNRCRCVFIVERRSHCVLIDLFISRISVRSRCTKSVMLRLFLSVDNVTAAAILSIKGVLSFRDVCHL